MYEKNLWEKIGDLLAHPGKRFLLGMLSVLVLGPFGVMIALSLAETQKTFFVSNVFINTSSGKKVTCSIIKQKQYAFLPVFPFFSLFYYIPYRTEYFLVKNIGTKEIVPGARIYSNILDYGIANTEKITKAKFNAIQQNPQTISKEIEEVELNYRSTFLRETEEYFNNNLFEEIYSSDSFSICHHEDVYILFLYSSVNGFQRGLILNQELCEKIIAQNDNSFIVDSILTTEPDTVSNLVAVLNDTLLERLLRDKPKAEENTSQETLERTNSKKVLLTKEIIEKKLLQSCSTSGKVVGWILLFFALGAFELTIFGFVSGLIVMGIICLPLGSWLTYKGISNIKNAGNNKTKILKGQYQIIKSICMNVNVVTNETDEGISRSYTHEFSTGEKIQLGYSFCVKGDPVYMVYVDGSKKLNAYYSGMTYIPDDNLKVEE